MSSSKLWYNWLRRRKPCSRSNSPSSESLWWIRKSIVGGTGFGSHWRRVWRGGSGATGATGLLLSRCGESIRTLLAARVSVRRRVREWRGVELFLPEACLEEMEQQSTTRGEWRKVELFLPEACLEEEETVQQEQQAFFWVVVVSR